MPNKKRVYPKVKVGLHPRSKHRERYNFSQLIAVCPELEPFVKINDYDDRSIDFFDPASVKMLNKALLKEFYGIENWDIPKGYLCPPIPGRADYIHYMADLLATKNQVHQSKIPMGSKVKCLDIGVGANCVYPIIGTREYGWLFVGSDIDPVAIKNAKTIVNTNPTLKGKIELRIQHHSANFYSGIINKDEIFDLSICNPPFHASLAEAQQGTTRKLKNLKHQVSGTPILNFGGQSNELWCEGGELRFVDEMIRQSKQFSHSCKWFSCLVSKQSNLKNVLKTLDYCKALDVVTIPLLHGNKQSRIVAWTFQP